MQGPGIIGASYAEDFPPDTTPSLPLATLTGRGMKVSEGTASWPMSARPHANTEMPDLWTLERVGVGGGR